MYQKNYRKMIITQTVPTTTKVLTPSYTKEIMDKDIKNQIDKLITEYEAMKGGY